MKALLALLSILLLLACVGPAESAAGPVFLPLVLVNARPTQSGAPARFETLPPGAALPSGAQCTAWVRPVAENKGDNAGYNQAQGSQALPLDFFTPGSGDERANTEIIVRVSGKFSGTTGEILQWAACKWGIDEDLVRAQAVIESWWHQNAQGDWGADPSRCPPGHGLGVDGRTGLCPESWGLLQLRYPYMSSAWPDMARSSAFNADTAYAIWRACYEGYEWWLNDVEQGRPYAAGDALGCMGRWFSGRWYTQPALDYMQRVEQTLAEKIWETPDFQEP